MQIMPQAKLQGLKLGNIFEILEPKKNTVTTDKNILLSFKAPRDTNVCIEVYHNSSVEKIRRNTY